MWRRAHQRRRMSQRRAGNRSPQSRWGCSTWRSSSPTSGAMPSVGTGHLCPCSELRLLMTPRWLQCASTRSRRVTAQFSDACRRRRFRESGRVGHRCHRRRARSTRHGRARCSAGQFQWARPATQFAALAVMSSDVAGRRSAEFGGDDDPGLVAPRFVVAGLA